MATLISPSPPAGEIFPFHVQLSLHEARLHFLTPRKRDHEKSAKSKPDLFSESSQKNILSQIHIGQPAEISFSKCGRW
jgi:hypothetical protein